MQAVRDFHVPIHLEESARYPGELEHQLGDLPTDFPHLYDEAEFRRGWTFVAEIMDKTGGKRLAGTVNVLPEKEVPNEFWVHAFSVDKSARRRGIGSTLLDIAIITAQTHKAERLRLVTLDKHSSGEPVMADARKLYGSLGFTTYKEETVPFGVETTLSVLCMERLFS
jgi:GNAT superfamily N-acetyltransferase